MNHSPERASSEEKPVKQSTSENKSFCERLSAQLTPILREAIHTYIHTIHTYNNNNNNNNNNNKRVHKTTSFYPENWEQFKKDVLFNESPGVHANDVLEAFMLIYHEVHNPDPQQHRLTQFFIQADQVNIAEKQLVTTSRNCQSPGCEEPAVFNDIGLAGPVFLCKAHHDRAAAQGLIKGSRRVLR